MNETNNNDDHGDNLLLVFDSVTVPSNRSTNNRELN